MWGLSEEGRTQFYLLIHVIGPKLGPDAPRVQ